MSSRAVPLAASPAFPTCERIPVCYVEYGFGHRRRVPTCSVLAPSVNRAHSTGMSENPGISGARKGKYILCLMGTFKRADNARRILKNDLQTARIPHSELNAGKCDSQGGRAYPMINKQRAWQSRLRPAISEFSRPPSEQGRRAGGTDRRDAGQRRPAES